MIVVAVLSVSSLSRRISPTTRTDRPGPGKGWRSENSGGSPRYLATFLTCSLNRGRSGSMILKPYFWRGFMPICSSTLCWVFTPPTVSIMSARIVPCTSVLHFSFLAVSARAW